MALEHSMFDGSAWALSRLEEARRLFSRGDVVGVHKAIFSARDHLLPHPTPTASSVPARVALDRAIETARTAVHRHDDESLRALHRAWAVAAGALETFARRSDYRNPDYPSGPQTRHSYPASRAPRVSVRTPG